MTSFKNSSLPPILEDINTGITLHDPESGDILDVNSQLEHLYGYPKNELQTMTVEDYTASASRFTQEEAVRRIQAAANGNSQTFEWQIERANGEYRWVNVHLTRTVIERNQYVIAEINDITEYRAREQLLRLLNRVIRHNLRNDMNVLVGYADNIKTAVESENVEEEINTILDIANEVGSLSNSLDQIENIVKPNATQREPANLRDLVQTHAKKAQSEHPSARITVETQSSVWVSADQSLGYAVENAIENAIEHNDQETPKITVSICDDSENNQGVISVSDTGPKIPAIEIDVLKDKSKADSTYHGSGVGLWIMKWCVDSLGGELSFEENNPRGNIVKIGVPKVKHTSEN
ncbi:ATP-binding protein [Natrialbaceae archaeon A-arb3/5]